MTFVQIQNRVLARHNLTSTEARTRVKEFINERYRRVRTSIGLGKSRRGATTIALVDGTNAYSVTAAKVFTVYDTTNKKLLLERTMDQIRALDPGLQQESSSPDFYAIEKHQATTLSVFIWPTPTDSLTLNVDILTGETELSADGDIPAFPEDFHDVLVAGALADEYQHKEKPALEGKEEARFERRLRDLRYFIAKSRYLSVTQNSTRSDYSRLGPNYEAND